MVNVYTLIPYENKSSRTHLNGIKSLQRTCHHFFSPHFFFVGFFFLLLLYRYGIPLLLLTRVGSHVFYSCYLYVETYERTYYFTMCDDFGLAPTIEYPTSSTSTSSYSMSYSFYSNCEFVTCALWERLYLECI